MKKIFKISLLQIVLSLSFISMANAYTCGQTFMAVTGSDVNSQCDCQTSNNTAEYLSNFREGASTYCCGFVQSSSSGGSTCRAYDDPEQYACGETNIYETVPTGAVCNCAGGKWESYQQSNFLWIIDKGVCCGFVNAKGDQCLSANPSNTTALCGETYAASSDKECVCGGGGGEVPLDKYGQAGKVCCGWVVNEKCQSTETGLNSATVSAETLNNLNPIAIGGGDTSLTTPGGIISRALSGFIFPIAGVILFVVLLLGGFQMLTGATNSKSIDEGKQRITAAIIGFILLFAAYWIAQLLELIFGIRILS